MQHMVVSCHAETNGKTFKHNRSLKLYYFAYDTLHDGLALSAFNELRRLSPSINQVPALWGSFPYNCRASNQTYPAGAPIPDYYLWNLDKKWNVQCGIFSFENFGHKYLLDNYQSEGNLLSKRIDKETSTLIWLACNA